MTNSKYQRAEKTDELSALEMEQVQGGDYPVETLAWYWGGSNPIQSQEAPYQGRRSSGGYVPT
jgi:hypothetical protein